MQREEAHPPRRVDRILMRVVPRLGDIVGNVVNGNDPIGERQEDEHNDCQCKETQEVHKRQTIEENECVASKILDSQLPFPGQSASFLPSAKAVSTQDRSEPYGTWLLGSNGAENLVR